MARKNAETQRGKPSERGAKKLSRTAPVFDLDRHLFYLFGQALGRRDRVLSKALAAHRSSVPKWRVLASLYCRDGCSLTQLAELTAVDRTTAMRTADSLLHEHMVRREQDPTDRRAARIYLTAEGRRFFARIFPLIAEQNQIAVMGLSEAELDTFRATLRQIIENLK